MAEIGNVSVKFVASASGLERTVSSAAKSLEAFGRAANQTNDSLFSSRVPQFSTDMIALTRQLSDGAIQSTRFTAALTSGFSRASAAITKGVTSQMTVLEKKLQAGVSSPAQFLSQTGGTVGASQDAAVESLAVATREASEAFDEGKISAKEFSDTIVELSATAAGGGISRLGSQIDSVSQAMASGILSADDYVGAVTQLYALSGDASLASVEGQLSAVHEQFAQGRVTADEYKRSVEGILTAFQVEAIAGYEQAASSVNEAFRKGRLSEKEFQDAIEALNATLDATVLLSYREALAEAEDQFGHLSQAASIARRQLANVQTAVDAAKTRISKSADDGGSPFDSIIDGMEKLDNAATAIGIELPEVFGQVTATLSGASGALSTMTSAAKNFGGGALSAAVPWLRMIGIVGAVGVAVYQVAEYFELLEGAQRLYAGKSIKDWEAEKRRIEERNAALATGARYQSQFGGRANEIRDEIARVKEAMAYGGSMSRDSGEAALEELNRQLEQADPRFRRIQEASRAFAGDMQQAARATEEVGNARADRALARYRRGYRELLASAGNLPEVEFKARVSGLAAAFDREMKKATALKQIGEEIAQIAQSSPAKPSAAALNERFGKFAQAQTEGAARFSDVRLARLEGIRGLATELGIDLKPAESTGFRKYMEQIEQLNAVVADSAEEEKLLADARAKAKQALVDARVERLRDLPGGADSSGTSAETAVRKFDADMARLREAREFIMSPDSGMNVREQAQALSDTRARERRLAEDFRRQNEGVLDAVASGAQSDRRANTASLSNTSDGMAAYFRILRGSDPVTLKQLREAEESRVILQKIADNTAAFKMEAAGL